MSMAIMNEHKGFHEDYLYKKENKGKWIPYWAKLEGKFLKFYKTETRGELVGNIEIESKSKCVVSKRKSYSFPFMLCAVHGRHLFKCESAVRRHKWMTALHRATELLKFSTSTLKENVDLRMNGNIAAGKANVEDDDEALPPNVVLVSSLPVACDSPTFPFKLRSRRKDRSDAVTETEENEISPKPKTVVYPFSRDSEESVPKITDLERKQFSSLNGFRDHSPLDGDTFSLRVRSFPSTPEDGVRPAISPFTLNASNFGKSKSLNSLNSRNDMRFSRHMVNDSDTDNGDLEL